MALRTRRLLPIVALCALLVVAGCSSAGLSGGGDGGGADGADAGGGDGGAAPAEATATQAPDASQADRADGDGGDAVDAKDVVQRERARIRTGEAHLRVENFSTARATLDEVASDHGGFVSDASQEVHSRDDGNRTWTTGTVTMRVPSENFTAAYEAAKAAGTVRSASVESRDVTDQLVDLEARIDNLEARRDRLRDLYDRTNDTEAVIEVGDRLSNVQGEIERLQAKRQSLREQVALSTITVRLAEPRPPAPATTTTSDGGTAFHEHGLVGAFLDSVDGVLVVLRSVAVFVAYAAPYLLVFGLPAVAYVGWRGWPFGRD